MIENFRPGVMDRLGLGAEQMTTRDDRLIYLSMPGFSARDERRDIAAWEGVVSAGVGTYVARLGGTSTTRPIYTAIPIASVYGAFVGVTATAMALVARERDGLGQRIESPLHDALYQAMGILGQRFYGQMPAPRQMPWVGPYECADGRWVFFHAAFPHFIRQFCEAAGVAEWLDQPWADAAQLRSSPELIAEARRRLTEIFKSRPSIEWEELINAAGPPTVRCLDSHEWLHEEHARASEAIIEIDDPDLGPMLQPGVQVRMSATPGAPGHPQHAPDADRDAILSSVAAAQPPAPYRGAPRLSQALEGIRALDLCIILAGPTCGRTLAEFGADVIKIDNPSRGNVLFHEDVNRGKRSIFLDLKSDAGRGIFDDLVENADVVVQNYRHGAVDRLGVGYRTVAARKPDIIYASLNAFGDIGPWARRAGWEQLAQAATGMQTRFGGDGPPTIQPFAINDYGTGIMGAFGVGMALYHRERTGQGQEIYTALARTAGTLQSSYLHGYEGQAMDRAARPVRPRREPAAAALRSSRRLALPRRGRRPARSARRRPRPQRRRLSRSAARSRARMAHPLPPSHPLARTPPRRQHRRRPCHHHRRRHGGPLRHPARPLDHQRPRGPRQHPHQRPRRDTEPHSRDPRPACTDPRIG